MHNDAAAPAVIGTRVIKSEASWRVKHEKDGKSVEEEVVLTIEV